MWGRRRRELPDHDEVEAIIDAGVTLAATLSTAERSGLHALVLELLSSKRWEAVGAIELTDEVLVTVAANAALPILELGSGVYRNVASILVQPGTRLSHGVRAGPSVGVVSDEPMPVVGEATPNQGPISVSWAQARADSLHPQEGRNVVIHELAHKIDMADGYTDGTPPLSGTAAKRWHALLADELERAEVRASDAALRPYAFTNPAEFFAVATETFFCTPAVLRDAKPDLYEALGAFYGQDPAARVLPESPGNSPSTSPR